MDIIARKEARDLGLKFYFTGKPCKHGHTSYRRTLNGMCMGCEAEQEYKNKKNITAKKHYEENKEHRKSCIKAWCQENREKVSSYKKNWTDNNKDYFKEYYLENKEYVNTRNNLYKINNKDVVNASNSFRRATKLRATPCWLSKDQLDEIKEIYNICLETTEQTGVIHHVDHIVPLVSEFVCGLHVPWNLQVITAKENLSKGNKYEDN